MDNSPNQTIIIPVTSQPKVVIIHLDSYSHLHGIPDKLGGINPELSITHVSVYVCILYKYIRDTGFASWRMLLRRCITTSTMTGGWLLLLVLPFFLGAPLDIYEHNPEKSVRNMIFLLETDIAICNPYTNNPYCIPSMLIFHESGPCLPGAIAAQRARHVGLLGMRF